MIEEWIERLSQPRPEFGGLAPCPYAKAARCVVFDAPIGRGLIIGRSLLLNGGADVVLLRVPFETLTAFQAACVASTWADEEVEVLVSDPRRPTVIDGYRTTQDEALLFFFQRRDRLEQAREALRKTPYYDRWPK